MAGQRAIRLRTLRGARGHLSPTRRSGTRTRQRADAHPAVRLARSGEPGDSRWHRLAVAGPVANPPVRSAKRREPEPGCGFRISCAGTGQRLEKVRLPDLRLRSPTADLLALPWDLPLSEWTIPDVPLRDIAVGPSRHLVKFVEADGQLWAVKELPRHIADKEYGVLRRLEDMGLP